MGSRTLFHPRRGVRRARAPRGVALILAAPALTLAATLALGGLLPLTPQARDRWPPSGAWRLPVGDAYQISTERPLEPGPFFVLRGVEWDGDRAAHQGADLGSGRSGAIVRAAAAGVVVRAADHGPYGGYGSHVVLAHRLGEGVLAYSVYAHLRLASLRVRAGQRVQAGQAIARVGATGRVTTPHLHFEVRTTRDSEQRWEYAGVEDPLAFVDERLPTHRGDTTGVEAFLEWGEYAALLPPGARAEDALTRESLWRMLAAVVRGAPLDPALEVHALREALIAARVLGEDATAFEASATTAWPELARDLGRVRTLGIRTGPGPFRRARHRKTCESVLGSATPAKLMSALSTRTGKPTLADAVLLFADLAGPRPEPPKAVKPRPQPARKIGPPMPTLPTLPATPPQTLPVRAEPDTSS